VSTSTILNTAAQIQETVTKVSRTEFHVESKSTDAAFIPSDTLSKKNTNKLVNENSYRTINRTPQFSDRLIPNTAQHHSQYLHCETRTMVPEHSAAHSLRQLPCCTADGT